MSITSSYKLVAIFYIRFHEIILNHNSTIIIFRNNQYSDRSTKNVYWKYFISLNFFRVLNKTKIKERTPHVTVSHIDNLTLSMLYNTS